MVEIKRWTLLALLLLMFVVGAITYSMFSKVGWNCSINPTTQIETCTRGVIL